MGRARAPIDVPGLASEAEARWHDHRRRTLRRVAAELVSEHETRTLR